MNAMSGSQRRIQRMNADYSQTEMISDHRYNLIMGGVVLFGLVVNILICFFCANAVEQMNPLLMIIGYIVCAIVGTIITVRSENPAISFAGYCLVVFPVGIMVCSVVNAYGGISSSVVTTAFLFTAIITATMLVLSTVFPSFFKSLGKTLLACLIGLLVCELICALFRINQMLTSWLAAIIFSLYIGYDFQRAQMFPKTADNAVDCALDIYLDIINLFLRLVRILARSSGSSSSSKNKF